MKSNPKSHQFYVIKNKTIKAGNPSTTPPFLATHLERLPELVAHDVVQHRVDAGRDVVQDAGNVRQDFERDLYCFLAVLIVAVDREQALRVEGRPAQEERYHHRHWKIGEIEGVGGGAICRIKGGDGGDFSGKSTQWSANYYNFC